MGNNMQAFYDGMTFVGSLVVIVAFIALTYYASRWYARRINTTSAGRYIKILDRVVVSTGCSMIIAQAGDKFYLIGVSEKNMQMLCELPEFDPGSLGDALNQASFGQLFQGFLKRAGNPEGPRDDGGEK